MLVPDKYFRAPPCNETPILPPNREELRFIQRADLCGLVIDGNIPVNDLVQCLFGFEVGWSRGL